MISLYPRNAQSKSAKPPIICVATVVGCLFAANSYVMAADMGQPPVDKDNITATVPQATLPETSIAVAGQKTDGAVVTAAPAATQTAEQLMVGDKLQVSFFEQLDLGQGPDAAMTAGARTFYQRLDLTGEHVVDAERSINIALLGRFIVAGVTVEEAQARIVEAYQSTMGRAGDVDIKIVDRRPIFVTGAVKTPGSFRYEPGMIALQAIALAGGYDREAKSSDRLLEAQRQWERHTQAVDRLERLMAKRLRLIQERDVPGNLTDGKVQKQSELDSDELGAPVASEMRLFDAESAAVVGDAGWQDAKVANAKGGLETLRTIAKLVDKQIEVRSERMRVLQRMQGRGFTSVELLWNAQKDVADFEMQRERLAAEMESASHNIVQTEAERVKAGSDWQLARERNIVAVDEEIDQQKTIINAAETMATVLETSTSGIRNGDPIQLRVMRRSTSGVTSFIADETTDLRPGDVIKVQAPSDDADPRTTTSSSL